MSPLIVMTNQVPVPKRYALIVFDWDGTLFDSTALITRSLQQAVVDVGGMRPSTAIASYVIGLGLLDALAHAAPDVPRSAHPELVRRYQLHYTQQQHAICLFEGIPSLLSALRDRGHWLGVATGKSRSGLDRALQQANLQTCFHATRTADETAGKPDPRMLYELMECLDVPAQKVLMIGDTTHDLEMAARAGCASVAVSYGAHSNDAFSTYTPRFVAHSVGQLHAWLLTNA